MELKISPTLLDNFEWYLRCPASWKQKAYQELVSKLKREPFQESTAILKGREFERIIEDMSNSLAQGMSVSCPKYYREIAASCAGGIWQQFHKCTFDLGYGVPIVSWGKFDVYFPDKPLIVDLKTSSKRPSTAKYTNGWQSKFYTYMANCPTMQYIVATWLCPGDQEDLRVENVASIFVHVEPLKCKDEIVAELKKFYAFLKMHKPLWQYYVELYSKNGEGSLDSLRDI